MRKAAYNRLGKKQTVKDVMIMNSYAPTLGFNNPKLTLKALGLCNTNPFRV